MMRLPHFRFHAARTVREAAELLAMAAPGEAMLVAGGTDLLPNMKRRQQVPATLVGLRRVAELRHVTNRDPSMGLIGAGVTLTELVRDPRVRMVWRAVQAAAPLPPAPAQYGHAGVVLDTRCNYATRTTNGGSRSISHEEGWADLKSAHRVQNASLYSTDTAPALLALGARSRRLSRLDAADRAVRLLQKRRHPLPDAAAERDPDRHIPRFDGWRSTTEASPARRVRFSGVVGRGGGEDRAGRNGRGHAHRARRGVVTTSRGPCGGRFAYRSAPDRRPHRPGRRRRGPSRTADG